MRCRASAHGSMGHLIDPLWWTHFNISYTSQCSTTGVSKVMICAVLSVIKNNSPCSCDSGFPFMLHTTGVTKAVVCAVLSVGWCI